jgi:hypothetical protein
MIHERNMYNVHKHRNVKQQLCKTFLLSILVHSKCMTSVNSWHMIYTYVRNNWHKIFLKTLFKYVINTVVWYMLRSWERQQPDQYRTVKLFHVFHANFEYIKFVQFFIYITAEYTLAIWSLHNWIYAHVQRLSVKKVVNNCQNNKNHSKIRNTYFNMWKINML